ncbi:von Willebrand factor, type A [Dillenia turbinata]|uniref:von Willebrand factor, type A n=1 Tax=Dillenia turbinata TaxID=194707 RepID=A0AAN8UFP5_9MAGN
MAAEEFAKAVEFGLKLSKRIYYGKDSSSVTPPETETMEKSPAESNLPTAPMVYAVIPDPSVVDNPDIPSYQPYVHGKCVPPALIPLDMLGISINVDCYLDTAFVSVHGTWRVHCVKRSRKCDCRIAIPMGGQGSVLGVEVDISGRSYHTQLIVTQDKSDLVEAAKAQDGFLLKSQIYTLKVPQVEGGCELSVKASWSQKLIFRDAQFSLIVPFTVPAYVNPAGKNVARREMIQLNMNSPTGSEILCRVSSHPLKELRRDAGNLVFFYEADVMKWSRVDFSFSYSVSSSNAVGGMLLQSPCLYDFDQREIFCCYLIPGTNQSKKVFKKDVVFIIDTSGSMQGAPLKSVKNALLMALSKLNAEDRFNIIAFSGKPYSFSSHMKVANSEAKGSAARWITEELIADGGTNILLPMNQAIQMLSETSCSVPMIFLVTDGTVEDERQICNVIKGLNADKASLCPRIYTLGIGSYCNHYFLQTLAHMGRGQYDASYDIDSIDSRMQRLFTIASSIILSDINIDGLDGIDSVEFYPFPIPDLSYESPVIISGRYSGKLPDSIKASGTMADMKRSTIKLNVHKARDFPLDRVFARREINILTARAWLSESKQIEVKVAKMSLQTGVPSEYACMVLLQGEKGKQEKEDSSAQRGVYLRSLGVGFGNLLATAENLPLGVEKHKPTEPTEIILRAASNCCTRMLDRVCCMCFIKTCSKVNDQCAIVFSQLCTALACFECLNCCYDLCANCG